VRGTALGGFILAAALAGSLACGSPPPDQGQPGVIGKEAFISAFVDLREAARRNGGTIDTRVRETVLANHEVTEEDLLGFAEAHGRDVSYMNDVWQEVERRLDSIRTSSDSGG
jgi:hypothetical protein